MKILSVDTSTTTCTVGIVDGDTLVAESVDASGQTHARHVMGMIDDTLDRAALLVRDLEGFAVVTGPGTFTGLRIGISTVKGLAYALSRPLVGISSLAALAAQADLPAQQVCPVMDARRKEVYFGFYTLAAGVQKQIGPHRVSPPLEMIKNVRAPCQFIGNGARMYQKMIQAELGPLALFSATSRDTVRAETIAGLAVRQFQKYDGRQLPDVSPYYIRKSDAELHSTIPATAD